MTVTKMQLVPTPTEVMFVHVTGHLREMVQPVLVCSEEREAL